MSDHFVCFRGDGRDADTRSQPQSKEAVGTVAPSLVETFIFLTSVLLTSLIYPMPIAKTPTTVYVRSFII